MAKNGIWTAVDLHVHSPFSKCFKGIKQDWSIRLLEQCVLFGIEIIAITDHNSIEGYVDLCKEKNQTERLVEQLRKECKAHPELGKVLCDAEQRLNLFNSVLVLPGIEYEAIPNVHLLFIFNPDTPTDRIRQLLRQGGYSEENFGIENACSENAWNAHTAIDRAATLGAIVIAAHVDSNKGIYNELSGKYRETVFKSDSLNGIQYCSSLTAEKIRSLLKNDGYKRTSPLAFLQFSDFHGDVEDRPGSSLTYFKLINRTFEALKASFKNPDEYISATEIPEVKTILNRILLAEDSQSFLSISEKAVGDQIAKTLCAYANSQSGSIVIGAEKKAGNKQLILAGIDAKLDDFRRAIEEIAKVVQPEPIYMIREYRFGKKHIYIIRVDKSMMPCHYISCRKQQVIYRFLNGEVTIAYPIDLVKQAEENWLQELKKITSKNTKKRKMLIEELSSIDDEGIVLEQVLKLKQSSYPLIHATNLLKILESVPRLEDSIEYDLQESCHGQIDGNLVVVGMERPRYEYCQLRYSAPTYASSEPKGFLPKVDACIILVPGGGAYLYKKNGIERRIILKGTNELGHIILVRPEFNKDLPLEVLIAYLKSSFCLWYIINKYSTTDIANAAQTLPIPIRALGGVKSDICDIINDILEIEKTFIEDEVKLSSSKSELINKSEYMAARTSLIDNHNHLVGIKAAEIDVLIYKSMNIPDNMIKSIDSTLLRNNYLPLNEECLSRYKLSTLEIDENKY